MTSLEKEFKAIQDKVDTLQRFADTQISKPKQLIKYTDHTNKKYQYSYTNNVWGTFDLMIEYYFFKDTYGDKIVTQEKLDSVIETFQSAMNKWKNDNEAAHEENKNIIAHNQLQFDRVNTIMETLGVKKVFTKSYYKTARSSKMTHEKYNAQWPSEVKDALPLYCGYNRIVKQMEDKLEKIKKFGENNIKENAERLRKEEQARMEKEKEDRKVKTMAGLCAKYDLDYNYEPDDIQASILEKDKYLYLAHYLLMNRNDWNDGYDYARTGLSGFEVVSEEDQKIYDNISSCMDDDFCDGRVFRDCQYNYDVLFSMANEEVLKDYNLISEFVEERW